MARNGIRSDREVVDRCHLLQDDVSAGLALLEEGADEDAAAEALWRGEALGTLLWALGLLDLPSYDRTFEADELVTVDASRGELQQPEELRQERETARLWHWRARTSALADAGSLEAPERFAGVDQLVAATAMRGHEQGLLPPPLRGDFGAFGKIYRHLTALEREEALSIALERHHALAWLCDRTDWDDVSLDT